MVRRYVPADDGGGGCEAWGVAKVVVTIVTSYRLVYMNFGIG